MYPSLSAAKSFTQFADDPDMVLLVDIYVDSLPERLSVLQEFTEDADWASLGRAAHQLKGTSDCYGFSQVSTSAARLELFCRRGESEPRIREAMTELEAICSRVCSRRPR